MGIIGGLSAALSQEPFRLWPLIFVSVFCFIFLAESYRDDRKNHFKYGFCVAWIVYAAIMCDWISFFGPLALVGFIVVQFIFAYAFVSFLVRIDPRIPLPLFYSVCWVGFEWILSHLPILSFSWLNISTALLNTPIVSLARVGGGSMLTFLIVFISSIVAILFRDRTSILSWQFYRMNFRKVGMVFVVLVILTTTSHIQLESNAKNVSVAVVQGNDKNRYLTPQEIEEEYLTNSHLELAAAIKGKRDIIVFPESAFNDDIEQDAVLKNDLRRISNKSKELIIANSIATEGQDDFNRNYFYSSEMKLLGTYDKKRLVPFGEYVPGDKFIGSWEIFDDIGLGYKKGESDLTVRGVTSVICYESTFTQDVRNALRDDSKLLVVTTNNRSYRRSGNSAQHLAQSRLRAAEFGISVVHASVSGSSALIERDGSVTERSKLFERKVVSGDLSFGKSDSIYSRTGDWLSLLALLVVVYLCLEQLRKRKWKNQT